LEAHVAEVLEKIRDQPVVGHAFEVDVPLLVGAGLAPGQRGIVAKGAMIMVPDDEKVLIAGPQAVGGAAVVVTRSGDLR
jgi:hypothetical protein